MAVNIKNLFTGIGVVIDDHVFDKDGDKIVTIVKALEDEHIPLVKFSEIPDINVLDHFNSVSFILLDWEFKKGILPGVNIGGVLEEEGIKEIVDFIENIEKKCFTPIFIFSNSGDEPKNYIKDEILNSLPILIKSKNEIVKENQNIILWDELQKWIDEHSGIYVQKIWNNSFEKARNNFLKKLNNNSQWPKALYEAAKEDDVDPTDELNELIVQNIRTRMTPLEFEEGQINKSRESNREELIDILQNQRFCPDNALNKQYMTGDVYKLKNKNQYYLNITPACDCIVRNKRTVKYILLECLLTNKPKFNTQYGHFNEVDTEALVGPLIEGKTLRIFFKKIEIRENKDLIEKYERKGRIQHPFITRIIQRYGFFIQRQGLPRIPKEIYPVSEELENFNVPQSVSSIRKKLNVPIRSQILKSPRLLKIAISKLRRTK